MSHGVHAIQRQHHTSSMSCGLHVIQCQCSMLLMPPTVCLLQIEAGIVGVSPGPSTEQFLRRKMAILRIWGALLVGILATAAQWFDGLCMKLFSQSAGSVSLLLLVGLITGIIRQVQSVANIYVVQWHSVALCMVATCSTQPVCANLLCLA